MIIRYGNDLMTLWKTQFNGSLRVKGGYMDMFGFFYLSRQSTHYAFDYSENY